MTKSHREYETEIAHRVTTAAMALNHAIQVASEAGLVVEIEIDTRLMHMISHIKPNPRVRVRVAGVLSETAR
jgi:hypothetical protein